VTLAEGRASTQAVWERARRSLPGGVSRDQLFTDPPLVIRSASGARLVDADGNQLLDFLNNYTSLIHGHAHPETVSAIVEQAASGTAFGAVNELEVELAEVILGRLPGADEVRFANSGTEATMLATQVARLITGRPRIAKFEGGYHGSHDLVRVSVKPVDGGDPLAPTPEPEPGAEGVQLTDVLPFHDVAAVKALAARLGRTWAAVIVEPLQGSAGMIPPPEGLLETLRQAADEHGFLLIFDEIITFRLGVGGLQEAFGVTPDLTALGKLIGGGLPVGAVAGKREYMAALAPPHEPRIHHSGTYNGNPLTMAAGLATLGAYDAAEIRRLNERGEALRASLLERLAPLGKCVSGRGSLLQVHLGTTPPRCWRDVRESGSPTAGLQLHQELRRRGFFVAPRGMFCLSTAHTEEDLTAFEEAVVAAAGSAT
jgi:glutamate-1-semialdehyde 2,1-aminomutase